MHTHLEKSKAHAKIIFADFSSAFNTIKPSILANILTEECLLEDDVVSWIVEHSPLNPLLYTGIL